MFTTFEGDNTVLCQQVVKELMREQMSQREQSGHRPVVWHREHEPLALVADLDDVGLHVDHRPRAPTVDLQLEHVPLAEQLTDGGSVHGSGRAVDEHLSVELDQRGCGGSAEPEAVGLERVTRVERCEHRRDPGRHHPRDGMRSQLP